MVKETVKLINSEEQEIEVKPISFPQMNKIQGDYIKITSMTTDREGNTTLNGDINMFGLQSKIVEVGLGQVANELDYEEGMRIYNKYYERLVKLALGKQDPK